MTSDKPIGFILPYPLHKAPSQRFRVEQLLFLLDEAKIPYHLYPFMDADTWQVLYKGGSLFQKGFGIVKGLAKRWWLMLFGLGKHDILFIHREAAPLGPPIFEWFATKVWKKKVIYDFDDAIWIPNTSAQNKIAASLKAFWKVPKICSWVHTVTGGNDFLCSFARENGTPNIVRIPTVVNTDSRYNLIKEHVPVERPVIGWTGSHSTLPYLDILVPILQELQQQYDFTFLVIADKEPHLALNNCRFIPWNEQTEIQDLLNIDVGVMPLPTDKWSEGKCGFKLIQYEAVGIPAVASDVGVNRKIIAHGVNGFICDNKEEWKAALEQLLVNHELREKMGNSGRQKMVEEYSVASIKPAFLQLFKL